MGPWIDNCRVCLGKVLIFFNFFLFFSVRFYIDLINFRYPYPEEGSKYEKFGFWELLDSISNKETPCLPESFSDEMKDFVSIWFYFLNLKIINIFN